jgi:hypothetical protein
MDIGRIKQQVTPLTMWRPDYDPYFDLPWYDDGNYIMDGVRFSSKFGSATTQLWAGSFASVTDDQGSFMAPIIGSRSGLNARISTTDLIASKAEPFGIIQPGGVYASENAGLHIGVPIGHIGEIGASIIDFSARTEAVDAVAGSEPNEVVYGGNFKLNPIGRFHVEGEYAKSVEQTTITQGAPVPNDDNNAYRAQVGWGTGGLDATVGGYYIDPRFAAPGYWAKIGNWYNPTNVEAYFARVAYDKNKLSAYVQGDALEGARNRDIITIDDRVYRVKGGVGYKFNKTFNLSADYEGVQFELPSDGLGTGRPIEQFLTFGAGVKLSGNTFLKVAYQIINVQDDKGVLNGVAPTGFNTSNASVITTQLAVHF